MIRRSNSCPDRKLIHNAAADVIDNEGKACMKECTEEVVVVMMRTMEERTDAITRRVCSGAGTVISDIDNK